MRLDRRIIGSLLGISILMNPGNLYATNGESERINRENERMVQRERMGEIIDYIKDNGLNYLAILL